MTPQETIRDVQLSYFDLIRGAFGDTVIESRDSRRRGEGRAAFLTTFRDTPHRIDAVVEQLPALRATVARFWNVQSPRLLAALNADPGHKGTCSQDLWPFAFETDLSPNAAYLETICVEDHVRRLLSASGRFQARQLAFSVVGYVLEILDRESLFTTKTERPICVLFDYDPEHTRFVTELVGPMTEAAALEQLGRMARRTFTGVDAATSFLRGFPTLDAAVSALDFAEAEFSDEGHLSAPQQLRSAIANLAARLSDATSVTTDPLSIWTVTQHGAHRAAEHLVRAEQLNACPIIRSGVDWRGVFGQVRQIGRTSATSTRDLHVTRALQGRDAPQLSLLSRLTDDQLLRLRREGVLSEFRAFLRKQLTYVSDASPDDLPRVVETIGRALETELARENERLLRRRASLHSLLGFELPTALVRGTLAVGAASLAVPSLGVAASLAAVMGASTVKSAMERFREHWIARRGDRTWQAILLQRDPLRPSPSSGQG